MKFYDETFFRYVDAGAAASAEIVVPIVQAALQPQSVLDVGCGQGAWLATWRRLGVTDVRGIDGDYVDRTRQAIPADSFQARDLKYPFNLGRRFEFVQSLEVAEHLPPQSAEVFVTSLVLHSETVLFSAAPPGQGGHGHVNERHYEFWRALFLRHHYLPIDFLRPRILTDQRVEPWYRFNPILYVVAQRIAALPDNVRGSVISTGAVIRDLAPLPYRVRKRLVRLLPVSLMTTVARVKERIHRPPSQAS
jgi:hypothetical protein